MSEFKCLSCGYAAQQGEVEGGQNVAKCPKCGRDMYRTRSVPDGNAPLRPMAGPGGAVRGAPVIPSRYGGTPLPSFDASLPEIDERNTAVLPHTPFIVVLGFIFSFLPLICIAGLMISIMGLNLVNSSPKGVRGKSLAIAGIAIGAVMTVLTFILMAMNRTH